jgi:hypothetical protein
MHSGRIGFFVFVIALIDCSVNVPETVVLDKKTHHLGHDTIPSWYVPLPEKTLDYAFDLNNPVDTAFVLGFICFGNDFTISINGDSDVFHSPEDPYRDSLKEPFLRAWLELLSDTAYVDSLRVLFDSSGFFPGVVSVPAALLEKHNTISFLRLDEDIMIGSLIVSDDPVTKNLRFYNLWRD